MLSSSCAANSFTLLNKLKISCNYFGLLISKKKIFYQYFYREFVIVISQATHPTDGLLFLFLIPGNRDDIWGKKRKVTVKKKKSVNCFIKKNTCLKNN